MSRQGATGRRIGRFTSGTYKIRPLIKSRHRNSNRRIMVIQIFLTALVRIYHFKKNQLMSHCLMEALDNLMTRNLWFLLWVHSPWTRNLEATLTGVMLAASILKTLLSNLCHNLQKNQLPPKNFQVTKTLSQTKIWMKNKSMRIIHKMVSMFLKANQINPLLS